MGISMIEINVGKKATHSLFYFDSIDLQGSNLNQENHGLTKTVEPHVDENEKGIQGKGFSHGPSGTQPFVRW